MTRQRLSRIGSMSAIAVAMMLALSGCGPQYTVLNPAGPVGKTELHLIILSAILVAIVIIPVLILLAIIVVRYRDRPDNKAPYQPTWTHSKTLEFIWWGIPIVIIVVLGTFTAKTTFALTKPPETNVKPITIEVMSLDWKWLFLYPDQHVATVNYAEIPTGVPVQFVLTADAPMNSFWIPQLGGQEYTMAGMAMRLWLQADKPGTYQGYGANFTGAGFAHMNFQVQSLSQNDFNTWVTHTQQSNNPLTNAGYTDLAKQSIVGKETFSSFPSGLFQDVVNKDGGKYMQGMPEMGNSTNNDASSNMAGMDMSNSTSNNTSK